jgi:hypothetical protein
MVTLVAALHPFRVGVALLGLLLSCALGSLFLWFFAGVPPTIQAWSEVPLATLQRIGEGLSRQSTGVALWRAALLFLGLWLIWGPLGCYLVRSLVVRDRVPSPLADAARLLALRGKSLLAIGPALLLFGLMLLVEVAFIGIINRLPVIGPVLVALLWPLLLLGGVLLTLLVLGLLACPLMAATIAVEASDSWEAISRGYSYFFTRTIRVTVLEALGLGLAALPLVPLRPLRDGLTGPASLLFLCAGLSLSLFWAVQSSIYLHLRRLVDGVDEKEIALIATPLTEPAATRQRPREEAETAPPPAPAPSSSSPLAFLEHWLKVMLVAYLAWRTSLALFTWTGGKNTGWAAWGVGPSFFPPEIHPIASYLVALWLLLYFGMAFLMPIRQVTRRKQG